MDFFFCVDALHPSQQFFSHDVFDLKSNIEPLHRSTYILSRVLFD